MPVDNSDLNELLRKATKPYKPWYRRWFDALIFNLIAVFKIGMLLLVWYSIGTFAMEHPALFLAMLAALG